MWSGATQFTTAATQFTTAATLLLLSQFATASTQFTTQCTCFTSTKVQILTEFVLFDMTGSEVVRAQVLFFFVRTCSTSTKYKY